jgi:hypothetical protein
MFAAVNHPPQPTGRLENVRIRLPFFFPPPLTRLAFIKMVCPP